MEIIKQRFANMSERGIYIQDIELLQTSFEVGSYFRFEEDQENKKVVILPSDEKGKNTVSKRKVKDILKPVIDIRKKTVLAVFEGCNKLEITIYKDSIEIVGIIENA